MAGGNVIVQVKLKGNLLSFPTKIASAIYRGTMQNVNAGGFLLQAGDTSGEFFAGISEESVTVAKSVANGTVKCRVRRRGIFKMTLATAAAAPSLQGDLVYVDTAHSSSVQELVDLAGNVTNHVLVGQIVKHGTDAEAIAGTSSTEVWVDILGVANTAYSATFVTAAVLAAYTAGNGAQKLGVENSTGFGSSQTVQDAFEAVVANGHLEFPLGSFTELDATGLLQRSSAVAGYAVSNSKELGILYPDDEGTLALIGTRVMPQDYDESADITVHFLVAKSGVNNSVTFDLTAYMVGVGDVNNDDCNDTGLITLASATDTPEEIVFTLGSSGLIAAPCTLNLIIDVVTGGTDEIMIFGCWIEYTRDLS